MRNAHLQTRARSLRRNLTDAEAFLWHRIRGRQMLGYRFRRQAPIAQFVVDFVCLEAKLIVELDGGQHQARAMHDARRTRILQEQGFMVLRFWNDEVFRETTSVLERIGQVLDYRCGCLGSLPPS
jgi:very-short-patch-repair endonuclease